jgi:aminomethyltransferase
MVTNDVAGLGVGASCYAAVLTVKGAMVGDVRVLRRERDVLLDTGGGRGGVIKAFLEKYLISEEAELHEAPELAVLGLVGPSAEAIAAKVPAALVLGRLRPFLEGVELLVEREQAPAVRAALGELPTVSEATAEVLRVERGVPRFGVDMTEVTIPLEANLGHAIHYKKGCYIGQEVIARATYRGQMNKKLVTLLLGDATPEPKTELRLNEAKVGWVTSVVRSPRRGQVIALGYVRRDHLAPGTQLAIASGGTATVAEGQG